MSNYFGFQPTENSVYHFISYNTEDASRVGEIARAMSASGIDLWYDYGIDTGTKWRDTISKKILSAQSVFLFFTKGIFQKKDSFVEVEYDTVQRFNKNSKKNKEINVYIILLDEIADEEIPLEKNAWWTEIQHMQCVKGYEYTDVSHLAMDLVAIARTNGAMGHLSETQQEVREAFLRVIGSKEFAKFSYDVMQRYYGLDFFVEINGAHFPVFCIQSKEYAEANPIKDFDNICDLENSHLTDFDITKHQSYKNNKWYPEYSKILRGKVRYPNRPGYMLDEIVTNKDGTFDKLRVHVGTYAENLYATHILEYELYKAFLTYGEQDLDDSAVWEALRNSLVIRNQMHRDVGEPTDSGYKDKMRASLLSGYGRDSLLSVQMLTILRSNRSHQYQVKIAQRSNTVAIKPGVYQFIPAGGFEILNDSNDDIYDDIELEENLSPGCAVFRELLEEMFNIQEFEGNGSGSVEERLLKDPQIVRIEKMLSNGMASLLFLGSVMDLAGMRHELSFALVIHDETYARTQFIANDECKKGVIHSLDISTFESKRSIWDNIHGPSAAMWNLFKQSPLYKKLIADATQ